MTGRPDERQTRDEQPEPVLPSRSEDDRDTGWNEPADREDDDERFLRERPPHW